MYKTDPIKHAAIASGMAGTIGERSDAVLDNVWNLSHFQD